MVDLILLLAAALQQVGPAEPPPPPRATASEPNDQAAPNEDIEVKGRRICKRITVNSAESRLGQSRICLTQSQWNEQREETVEMFNDLPRRNPRKGPSATEGFSPN